jgi:hypothetical protein
MKIFTKGLLYIIPGLMLLFICSPTLLKADTLQVTSNITPEQLVQQVLIGGGVVTSNITYTGAAIARGKFWGGPGNIGIRDGVILTSGSINIAKGPNNNGGAGNDNGLGGDPDLNAISGVNTFDACVLEFDFIPQSTVVSFRYVFASEEYHEYVNSYNDAFGFFISGPGITGPYSNNSKNIALIPLSTVPVTINTVNCGNPYNCQTSCENCQFFVNNTQNFTQYDAFTTVLSAWANVTPCETYHIKLAIGDGVDHIYDSGVFLEANSFTSVGIANEVQFTTDPDEALIEGCNNAEITFTLSIQPDDDFYMPLYIGGTATNGVDYEELPDTILFPQGYSQVSLDVITLADQIPEWFEYISIVYNSSLCDVEWDTITLNLSDYKLALQTTPDTMINCATPATIGIRNIIGFEPYHIQWNTGDTTQYITVSPPITTTYYVSVSALCDSTVMDSIKVIVNGPKSSAGPDLSIPYGTTTTLQGSASQGSGNFTYSWTPANKLVDPTVATPTTLQMQSTTQFTLLVTDLAGGCQDMDQMLLQVTGGPLNVGPLADPNAICPGESSHLYAYASGGSENYTYQWSSVPPGFSSNLQDPVVQPSLTTSYHVQVDDGYNTISGSAMVTVYTLPVPDAGENDTIYHGTTTQLHGAGSNGSGNYAWSWEPANKLINAFSQNPITIKLYETTLFRLSVTDIYTGCVCYAEDLVTVVIEGGPLAVTAEITDSLLCEGGSTQLHALPSGGNPVYEYSWTSDPPGFTSNEQEPVVSALENTTYTVEVFDGFNYFAASVNLIISNLPVFDLGPDKAVCPYDSVTLSVNLPGMDYYWSNGSIEPSVTVGTTGIGFDIKNLWVEVTNPDGCMTTDNIQVIFDFAECSGVEEQQDNVYIHLFPNPTTGMLQVEWKGLYGLVSLRVEDIHGKAILSKQIQAPASGEYAGQINLKGQPDGIYLVKFIDAEQVLIRKVLLH